MFNLFHRLHVRLQKGASSVQLRKASGCTCTAEIVGHHVTRRSIPAAPFQTTEALLAAYAEIEHCVGVVHVRRRSPQLHCRFLVLGHPFATEVHQPQERHA